MLTRVLIPTIFVILTQFFPWPASAGNWTQDQIDSGRGPELWVKESKYGGTIQGALTAIGANKVTLRLPPGVWNITSDLTIPANITLKPEPGALLNIFHGKVLSINGGFETGQQQVFTSPGFGKVLMSGSPFVLPQWWGAKGDDRADDWYPLAMASWSGRPVFLPPGTYRTTTVISIVPDTGSIHEWFGAGPASIIHCVPATLADQSACCISIMADDVFIHDLKLQGDYGGLPYRVKTGTRANGIEALSGKNRLRVERVEICNFGFNGIWIGNAVSSGHILKDNYIHDNLNEHIVIVTNNTDITNNRLENCLSWGLDICGSENNISNNQVTNCGSSTHPFASEGDGGLLALVANMPGFATVGNKIQNNILNKSDWYGIYVDDSGGAQVMRNNLIANNIISNYGQKHPGFKISGPIVIGTNTPNVVTLEGNRSFTNAP